MCSADASPFTLKFTHVEYVLEILYFDKYSSGIYFRIYAMDWAWTMLIGLCGLNLPQINKS